MEPKAVIFDLDGTLTESGKGIMKAAIAGLAAVGRESGGTEKLQKLIGPPLTEGFSEVYGLTEDECKEAVCAFRAYYETKGIFENELYPGALNLLRTLRELGTALYLATSKPELQARRVLAAFSLTAYFKGIAGGDDTKDGGNKEKILARLVQTQAIPAARAVMVGDRAYDICAANALGIAGVGVTYGYGSREELEKAGATHIVSSIDALTDLLLRDL